MMGEKRGDCKGGEEGEARGGELWKSQHPVEISGNTLIGLRLSQLVQDTEGVEIDGLFYPPTFDWVANISAARADGKDFYVKLRIPPDEVHPQQIWTYILHAFFSLRFYMTEEK